MAKTSTSAATDHIDLDGLEGHYGEVEGYTVGFERYNKDDDPAPLFKGLPEDHCQCPHWGVVLKGTLIYNYLDGTQDVITAGEAYYAKPGHLPVFKAGTRVVEFSPTVELGETVEVIMANVAAMQAG